MMLIRSGESVVNGKLGLLALEQSSAWVGHLLSEGKLLTEQDQSVPVLTQAVLAAAAQVLHLVDFFRC